ncbi:energy-coupling factor transport system substrate-specific component [Ruminococcaceae bacterium YRB3002]|nr:energy-coupling factor transport system substrate-specific component [Ruminococcaceae bacterium YRB3002]
MRFTVKDIATIGVMTALIEAVKWALQAVPNVELVTLMFMVFAVTYGPKTCIVSFIFTAVETVIWGPHIWVIMYLYIWPLLILTAYFMSRKNFPDWGFVFLGGFFGLFFGMICAVPYLFFGGLKVAVGWWIAGIPFDILHCISNTIICLVLFKPLRRALERILKPVVSGRQ